MRFRPLLLLFCLFGPIGAQEEAPPNGPRRIDPAWHALVGATVHVAPGRTLSGATVVLRGDRIGILDRGQLQACGTLEELREQADLPEADLEDLFLALTGRERKDAQGVLD